MFFLFFAVFFTDRDSSLILIESQFEDFGNAIGHDVLSVPQQMIRCFEPSSTVQGVRGVTELTKIGNFEMLAIFKAA